MHRLALGAAVTSRWGAVGGSSGEACRSAAPPTAPLPSRRVAASRGQCRWCGGGAACIVASSPSGRDTAAVGFALASAAVGLALAATAAGPVLVASSPSGRGTAAAAVGFALAAASGCSAT